MQNRTYNMILVSIFAALTAIGAFYKIPLPPVPFTLQLFFVIFAGLLLGPKLGLASQMIYIILGLTGVPIFVNGGGIQYVFNPTFGYLLGFAAGAYTVGKTAEKLCPSNPTFTKYFIASLFGLVACYAIGLPYLYIIVKYVSHMDITVSQTLIKGFLVFLPWDIAKIIAASWLAKAINSRIIISH